MKHNAKRIADRIEAINHYGGRCSVCGITDQRVLHFHHRLGNGKEHRQDPIYKRDAVRWFKLNNWPEGFEILCANCHAIHHFEEYEKEAVKT